MNFIKNTLFWLSVIVFINIILFSIVHIDNTLNQIPHMDKVIYYIISIASIIFVGLAPDIYKDK